MTIIMCTCNYNNTRICVGTCEVSIVDTMEVFDVRGSNSVHIEEVSLLSECPHYIDVLQMVWLLVLRDKTCKQLFFGCIIQLFYCN